MNDLHTDLYIERAKMLKDVDREPMTLALYNAKKEVITTTVKRIEENIKNNGEATEFILKNAFIDIIQIQKLQDELDSIPKF